MPTYTKHTIPECPVVTTQKVISGKWTILILHHIENGPVRFNELQRLLSGVSHATLTKQLRQLEEDGLIERKVYAQVPPKVEYTLSPLGDKFKNVLQQIEVFGEEYIDFIKHKD